MRFEQGQQAQRRFHVIWSEPRGEAVASIDGATLDRNPVRLLIRSTGVFESDPGAAAEEPIALG